MEVISHHGHLALDALLAGKGSSHPFRHMCQRGWVWTRIPAEVEEAFPKLPQLLSAAYNADHILNNMAKEMEVAAGIAEEYCKDKLHGNARLDKAIEAAGRSEPQCKKYLHV